MKYTSEMLMKAMGLSVGDRIKIDNKIFEIYISPQNELRCGNIHNSNNHFYLKNLIDKEIEILPRPKRVGDTLCKDCECVECHLRCLPYCNQLDNGKKTLFNILDGWNEYNSFDQEIHDLLKARLDKVVIENEIK